MNNKLKIEKLENSALESISGGDLSAKTKITMLRTGEITSATAIVGAVACTIAGAVCATKATDAALDENGKKYKKYTKAKNRCLVAAECFMGVAAAGAAVSAVGIWG